MTATVLAAAGEMSTGEAVAFWILAPLAVLAALGMVLTRNAVHGALLLVLDFFALAVFYVLNEAPFLAAVQIIVYTGAIMTLFLFVLMLVGVDSSDSLVEVLRGQRLAAALVGLGFVGLLAGLIGSATNELTTTGLGAVNAPGNVQAIAALLFSKYVFAFEATSALLITAALGAMVLAHKERKEPRPTQRELSRARFASGFPTPTPGPGVYALSSSVDTPARLPDGSLSRDSVPRSITAFAPRTSNDVSPADRAVLDETDFAPPRVRASGPVPRTIDQAPPDAPDALDPAADGDEEAPQ